jgi:hypothetical protein
MIASITRIQSPLNFSWIRFRLVIIIHKYLNCATFSKYLLAVLMSWFCPAFWWRDSNIHLVFSVFTSRPTSLLASVSVSVFFFMVSYYHQADSHHQYRPAADVSCLISVPPGFPGPSWWHILKHSWKSIWRGNLSDKCLLIQTLLYVSFKHNLISLTSFTGAPNSIRILYSISLLTES